MVFSAFDRSNFIYVLDQFFYFAESCPPSSFLMLFVRTLTMRPRNLNALYNCKRSRSHIRTAALRLQEICNELQRLFSVPYICLACFLLNQDMKVRLTIEDCKLLFLVVNAYLSVKLQPMISILKSYLLR